MSDELVVPSAEASVWIDATPEVVWRSMGNIESLSQHSPETIETEWLPGSNSHEVGAAFRGHNRNKRAEWNTDCVITHCTEAEQFGFGVSTDVEGTFSTSWLYTLTPEDGGTRVTESFESPYLLAASPEMSKVRPQMLEDMMAATLASI
jgi:Polyketide cyclase / dehydrase and lipid transport